MFGSVRKNNSIPKDSRQKKTEMRTGEIPVAAVPPPGAFFGASAETAIYKLILESLSEGVLVVNRRMEIVYANPGFAKLAGTGSTNVTGVQVTDFLTILSDVNLYVLVRRALRSTFQDAAVLNCGNSRRLRVQISVCAIRIRNRTYFGITVTDLSLKFRYERSIRVKEKELREKHAELEKANRDLSSFSFIASHHLQEPLRKIQTFVSLIYESRPEFTSRCNDYFSRIMAAANRMQGLIADILAYCSSGKADFDMVETDLNELLRQVLDDFSRALAREVKVETDKDLPRLKVIPFQIKQMFQHLLGNSAKFCPAEKPLHIRIQCGKKTGAGKMGLARGRVYTMISFTDNGIGFDQKYSERIFDIFEKLHRTDESAGTGIGLAICRRVAENHGGTIVAVSKEGSGACFEIYLPVS